MSDITPYFFTSISHVLLFLTWSGPLLILFQSHPELNHPICDPMISCSSTPLRPGDYPLGNSSRPAVNMHLGMSLLETVGDGGFMVS